MQPNNLPVSTHFSDFFNILPETIEHYGAFNISIVNDLPVFIDPFLLFNSENPVYQQLHEEIIRYLAFLREKSTYNLSDSGLLNAWYRFGEVKQTWLGYSKFGNGGRGLGNKFAYELNQNLYKVFNTFGKEQITKGSHLEKLCLVTDKVGRDMISDFTTNLIKHYLLTYTQKFAQDHIDSVHIKEFSVQKVKFNYDTETWESGIYFLPSCRSDFVLLTPKDILTKDELWISKEDLYNNYNTIVNAVPNHQLRSQLNNYLKQRLSDRPQKNEVNKVINSLIKEYPAFIDHYIKYKEDTGQKAVDISEEKVQQVELLFIKQVQKFVGHLKMNTSFYNGFPNSYNESRQRIIFLKDVIEKNDGYKLFYVNGKPVKREKDLQLFYSMTWYATKYDVNREVNNGRGFADYTISKGKDDKTVVEFKLASNSSLKKNLNRQVEIYEQANNTKVSLKVIMYFTKQEFEKVQKILADLNLIGDDNIILIDARNDNKPSASKA